MYVQATVPGSEMWLQLIDGFESFFLWNYFLQFFETYERPVRNKAPLGFESRFSGTRISNGVNQILSKWHKNTIKNFGIKEVSIRLLIEKEQIEAFHLFPGEETTKAGGGQENKFLDILKIFG